MNTFVILTAGRGTRIGRVGEHLHKALVPIDGRAVLSHIIELAPTDARIIIAVGHRAEQIDEYVDMAHPHRDVTFVRVSNWDKPGSGPGASLLACKPVIDEDDGDLYFTSCDTIWHRDELLWRFPESWMGVATMPSGTSHSRWCRVMGSERVEMLLDKTPLHPEVNQAYVGLGHVARRNLATFWNGILAGHLVTGERQVTNGFTQILKEGGSLRALHVDWTDVGDEDAYRDAVLRFSGYDWTKLGQATYVLPKEGRVVKFADDVDVIQRRVKRANMLTGVPPVRASGETMFAYDYVPGPTVYEALLSHRDKASTLVTEVCAWYLEHFTERVNVPRDEMEFHAMRFYRDKTFDRIAMLPTELRLRAMDAISRINWQTLVHFTKPVRWHGDLNFGNIIVNHAPGRFVGIDWREDFDGVLEWGDMRYDVAKLIGGTVIHWQRAMTGDMRPWEGGEDFAQIIREVITDDYWIEIIGGLTLLNSSPLHASPLDEVLVSRGCAWLEKVMR